MILAVNATRKNIFTLILLVLTTNVIHTRSFLVSDRLGDVVSRLQQQPGRHTDRLSTSSTNAVLHGIIFRGKGIPYAESYEEQRLRFLWENEPFKAVQGVVSSVLSQQQGQDGLGLGHSINNKSNNLPLLKRIENVDQQAHVSLPDKTGYEDLFQNLYCNDGADYGTTAPFPTPNANTRSKKWGDDKVKHYALVVAYRGDDFCGWQRQPNNNVKPSVQGTLEDSLQSLLLSSPLTLSSTSRVVSGRQQRQQREQHYQLKPPNLRVCGRTDSGVHAVGQVCRLRTTKNQMVTASIIQNHLNCDHFYNKNEARQQKRPLGLKCLYAQRVPRSFHPTFGATCRAYMYLIDIPRPTSTTASTMGFAKACGIEKAGISDETSTAATTLTREQIERLNDMLEYLEQKDLDYIGLSYGKLKTQTSNCVLYHAKAHLVEYGPSAIGTGTAVDTTSSTAICIELVGNRFLRRMVRLLVATALRLVFTLQGLPAEDALYKLILECDRSLAHQPAPPNGLMFVGSRFSSET